jgi:hypothetical protein
VDKDLQQLIKTLERDSVRKAPGPRKAPPAPRNRGKQTALLATAILFLLGGVGYFAFTLFESDTSTPDTQVSELGVASTGTSTEGAPSSLVGQTGSEAGNSESVGKLQIAGFRPKNFIEKKYPNVKFIPVSQVVLPKDKSVLTLYCLMRVELDKNTLQRWKSMDMIESERSEFPFIRKVILRNQEALDNLFDWHVEAVTQDLIGTPPAPTPPTLETQSQPPATEP